MARSSRLKRHQMREGRRQIYIYLSLIIILIVLLFTFGARIIEFIGNASFLIRGDEGDVGGRNEVSIVQAPLLEPLPVATSTEGISVKGSVIDGGGTVELYVNGRKYDEEDLDADETDFSFDATLDEGENTIRAKYVVGDNKSGYSESQRILFTKEKPKLENVSPSDGQEFKRGDERIEVSGDTNADNKVTVNGFQAFVETSGHFSYFLKLNEGDNKVTVVATNKAGLEETKEFTVRYSP